MNSKSLKKVFTAIFPGLIVAGLIFGANVYYDLDLGKVIVQEITKIIGMFETTATTTLATVSGYVGIATSTPTEALTVSGNILSTGNLTISGGKIFGANQEELWIGFNNDLIQVVRGPTPTTYIVCDSSGNCAGNYNYVGGTGTPNYLAKFSATSTLTTSTITEIGGVVNIPGTTTLATTAGFVGIATSTPYSTEKLTVYGNIWGSGNIILQKGSYNITLTPATLTANRTITFPDLSGIVAVSSTAPITLSSTGVIGLTTPLAISYGGTATSSIGSAGSIVYSNGTTYAFTSVGIAGQPLLSGGSGAPTWGTLSVSFGGTGLTSVASGALLYGSGGTTLNTLSLGSPGTILTASTSAPYWASLSSLSIATGTGAANYIAKWTGTNTLSTSTIVEVGGFVGIGTSSPAYLLDVYSAGGNTIRLGASSTDTVLIGGGEGKLTAGIIDPWLIKNQKTTGTTTLTLETSASQGDIIFKPLGVEKLRILENGNLLFPATATLYTSGNDNQLVLAANGKVGIGTSAPLYTLDVNGSLRLQPISTPTATSGVIYYDSTADKFKCYQQGGITNCISNGVATIIVAASDSQQKYKADYICSGSGDQTTINNAISALPSGGGIIYLLEGTYNLTGPITITKSNVAIIGSGKATILKRMWDETLPNNSGVITVGDGTNSYEGILISNLQIDGNKGSYTSTYNHAIFFKKYITKSKIKGNWIQNSAGHGIYFYAAASGESNSYNIIEGNDIRSNYYGIYLPYSSYNTISGNTVQGNGSYGILLSSSSNNTISGNTVQGNSSIGISLSSSSNNTISGNTVQGNGSNGIYLYSSLNNTISGNNVQGNSYYGIYLYFSSLNNTISGNNVQGNSYYGIYLYFSSNNNTISGNTVQGNGYHGIYLSSSSNNAISGNKIHDNGGSGAYDGIKIDYNSDANLISSNDITDTAGTGYAINISSSDCDNNYLVGNRYSGTGASSINDSGTGTIYGSQLFGDSASSNLILKPVGNVGIGTTTPAATLQVYGNVKLNLPGAGTGYALCHTTQTGTTSEEIVDCTSAPSADYAEMYPVEEGIEPGDLVAPSSFIVETTDGKKLTKLTKTTQPYQSTMIGVVSDPKDITDFNVIGYNIKDEDNPMPVALSGRVLVKVSTENGEIKPGDLLTSASSTPGVAMKATEPGRVIGIALEGYKGERIGKITVFVNPHFWLGPIFEESTTTEQLGILDKFTLAIKRTLEKLGLIIENGIAQIKEIITEKLSAKVVVTNQLCLGQTCIDEAKLKELLEKTGTIGTTNNQATNNGAASNQATSNGTTSNETVSNQPANNGTTNNETTSNEQSSNEQLNSEHSNNEQLSSEQSGNEQLNSEQSGNEQSEPSTTTAR